MLIHSLYHYGILPQLMYRVRNTRGKVRDRARGGVKFVVENLLTVHTICSVRTLEANFAHVHNYGLSRLEYVFVHGGTEVGQL